MTTREHWQSVYKSKAATEVSWFATHLDESLRLIREVTSPSGRIIDVGGGASTLVDDLLGLGYCDVTVLDVSEAALEVARKRLGKRGAGVHWVAADVTTVELERDRYDLWHDRAVFHFLTGASDRQAYIDRIRRSLVAGGYIVIGTFAMTGPTRCSGLDVVRYDVDSLSREFGSDFTVSSHSEAMHVTPASRQQQFLFCRLRKR
jgi:ubiquinone/menaquinone biosynthesis C-methylase UbiE